MPRLTSGSKWPFRALGLGYGALAIAVLVIGAVRQRRTGDALRRGAYDELSTPLVVWLTAAAVTLSVMTLAVVLVAL